MRPALAVVVLVLVCLTLPGCIAAAAGVAAGYGAHQYMNNEAYEVFNTNLQSAWNASLSALAEVGAPVASPPALGTTDGIIRSGSWWVRVEKLSECQVRVRVRVGKFSTADHRRRAGLYLDAVRRRLGQ